MQHPRHLPLIILVLVAAGAAGFGVYRWLMPGSTPPPSESAVVMSSGDKPMTAEQALGDKMEGLSDGASHRLADWRGKAVLVNFWATWCAPCREEIPLLVKLQAQYAAQGFTVVGIATDETSDKDVKDYLKRMVVNYPMLMGNEDVGRLVAGFGGDLIGLPYTLLLSRDGKVLKLHAGELSPDEAQQLVALGLNLPMPAPAGGSNPAPAAASGAQAGTAAK
ncbi:MAG: TlpA disulfide reductase family protein [Bacillota bacterium]